MSLRKMNVQFLGNCLRLPTLERNVILIETEDGQSFRRVRTCELEPLEAFYVTLNMLNETSWGVCSECGTASPMDATFCCECGRKVER